MAPRSSLRLSILVGITLGLAYGSRGFGAPAATLTIDAATQVAHVSPIHSGLMTEEINHSTDGGLYAELIRNRTFREDKKPVHWSIVSTPSASTAGEILIEGDQEITSALTTALRVDIAAASPAAPFEVANEGYWGIPVKPHWRYRASFYARAGDGFEGPVRVAIVSEDGRTTYTLATVPALTGAWQRYALSLTTGELIPTARARFTVSFSSPGKVWLTLVSLFPPTWNDRPNGNRIDLMQRLADLHPAFLRFPGGDFLEGNTIATRFKWKETIHGLAERPGHPGRWHYWSTDGMGLLEYLEWCEDLGIEPVLAVFAGYTVSHECVPPGGTLQPYVQDALDEIEYVTGDPSTTRWGAERARDGHPRPFALTYVEVGNEDFFDKSGSYEGRFAQFFDAIKAQYPALQVIATTRVKSRRPDVLDEHFYRTAAQFESDAHHYDRADRQGPKIFVGEWATREGSPTPNLNAALGDSAWMTGMERNSDFVIMNAYAPLFVNVNPGAYQWKTNLIGYDALTSFGSPAYYAQALFNRYRGDTVVGISLDGPSGLFASVTKDQAKGILYLKLVNTTALPQVVRIKLAGVATVDPAAKTFTLAGASPTDTNTLRDPERIVPVASSFGEAGTDFNHPFPPYSLSVVVIQTH